MNKMLIVAFGIALCAVSTSAQTSVSAAQAANGTSEAPRVEFFGGYSRLQTTTGGSVGFNGFNTSITGNVSDHVGLKFDLSGHYRSGFSFYTTLGGVQLKNNSPDARYKPFVHAMVGAGRARASFGNSSTSGFAGAFGGGLDIRVSKRIDARVLQIDYAPVNLEGVLHNVRFGAGVVFH